MALGNLLELVETLNRRIEEHGEELRKNEALTRIALIDPLLRELGWNIEDPAQVIPEYPTGNNEDADYVLLTGKQRLMVIEAKSLDSSLHERASKKDPVTQANNYAFRIGTRYFSITNGKRWEIYDRQRSGDANESKVVQFDITESPAKVCLKALALWRPGVEAGSVGPAQPSIIEHRPPADTPTPAPRDHTQPSSTPDTDSTWIPYSKFQDEPEKGPPAELKFPDGKNVQIRYGYEVAKETVRWLFEKGHLKPDHPGHCPIQKKTRYILATDPVHPSGEDFTQAKEIRTRSGTVYIEAHYSKQDNIKNTLTVIKRTGQNPTEFQIRRSS